MRMLAPADRDRGTEERSRHDGGRCLSRAIGLLGAFALAAAAAPALAQVHQLPSEKLLPPPPAAQNPHGPYYTLVGEDVAISGDWAMVATARSGRGGEVFVYKRTASGWTYTQTLTSGQMSSWFGSAVTIDGDRAAIGSLRWTSPSGRRPGRVYAYDLEGDEWVLTQVLTPDAPENDNLIFGSSIDLAGDILAIGGPGVHTPIFASGGFHIYERLAGGEWIETARFRNPVPAAAATGDVRRLGSSVAASAEGIVVAGAPGATGAAFVYECRASGWSRVAVLRDPSPQLDDTFGCAVAVDGDTIVVGEHAEPAPNPRPGAAFIFERSAAGEWLLQQELAPSDPFSANDGGPEFGSTVAIQGDDVLVGMPNDGNPVNNAGSLYLFRKGPTGWPRNETRKLVAFDPTLSARLGFSLDMDSGYFISGAVNANSHGGNRGAAYLFEDEVGRAFCGGGNGARLTGVDTGSLNDALTLSLRNGIPGSTAVFAEGTARGSTPFGGAGALCLERPSRLGAVTVGPSGTAFFDLEWSPPVLPGSKYFQVISIRAAGGASSSNAITVDFP